MDTDSGRSPHGSGSHASHGAAKASPPTVSIPNARSSIGFEGIRHYGAMSNLRKRVAAAIANELGDPWDKVHADKSEWIKDRGGEPFRDVNLPFRYDYMAAADVVIGLVWSAYVLRDSDTQPKAGDAQQGSARE